MNRFLLGKLVAVGVAMVMGLLAVPASAQATRTWVSGVGDDVNPCSRTAPCKTFAGAISKTAAGGEINCLDPGGYGTLTITKSITVDCTGTFGSTLNSGGINGFVINDSATGTPNTINVILRGLSIDGAGTTPGLNGIRFISGKSLVLEDVFIQNQKSGNGISFQPTANAKLYAENVTIINGAGGILIQPTGTGSAAVELEDVRVQNNTGVGLHVNTTGNTSITGTGAIVKNSEFSGGSTGINVVEPTGNSNVDVTVSFSLIDHNTSTGINANGTGTATIRVDNSIISANSTGVLKSGGGIIQTYGNNILQGNTVNGVFSAAAPAKQ